MPLVSRLMVAVVFFLAMFAFSTSHAQKIGVDLSEIDSGVAKSLLENIKKLEEKKKQVVDTAKVVPSASQAKEWADVGENVAKAIGAAAKALGTEVNDFVKTPVGWWVSFFVFWYLLGKKIWMIIGGVLMWSVITGIIWRSYRIFHVPQRILVKELADKTKVYETRKYDFKSGEARATSATAHAAFFLIFTIVAMIIIF